MSLSGSLREFHLSEIVQLLSGQRKTGKLHLQQGEEETSLYFEDGRLVAVREPGLSANDPLMKFLRRVHWLSDEQLHGIETLHAESGRDLVDILLNGRYLDAEELTVLYERMTIDQLFRLLGWDNATYSFSAGDPPPSSLALSFSTDGLLMESVRRLDESRRYLHELPEGHEIPGLRELPDPDTSLGEDEKELFALVDGNRTIAEVVAEAPLCDFEALEGLHSLFENGWLEVVGSREVGGVRVASKPSPRPVSRRSEFAMTAALAGLVIVLTLITMPLRRAPSEAASSPEADVFQRERWGDVEMALEVYERANGRYPERLAQLVESEWLVASQLRFPGFTLVYECSESGGSYELSARAGIADTVTP
jgi:hypothetical protein